MLKLETGKLNGKCYAVCRYDTEDLEKIRDYIGEENTHIIRCSNGVGINLKEIVDGVSRPLEEDNIKLIEDALEEVNEIFEVKYPSKVAFTITLTKDQYQTLKEVVSYFESIKE